MNKAWIEHAKLFATAAARAAGVMFTYVSVATLTSWVAFAFAARDIWSAGDVPGGRFLAHSGGGPAAGLFLVALLFITPHGWVTLAYLAGFPLAGVLLGKQQAVRAAIHRLVREKVSILSDLVIGFALEVAAGIAERPGAERASGIARKLNTAVGSVQGSFFTRFVLRNLLKAIRVDELLMATDFIARIKTEPDAAREQLRAQVEPRLIELAGKASFRPLLILLAVIVVLTLTSGYWTKLYV